MIAVRDLAIGRHHRALYTGLSFHLPAGECWAVVGRNGSGKSTLLATLAGLIPALAGEVRILEQPLADWRRPLLARQLGLLPQYQAAVFPYTIEEFVQFGRLPWRHQRGNDRTAIEEALLTMELQPLRTRPLTELSGGEVQRACIAQLLAQSTSILLLDEPVAHLDLLHQVRVLRLLRGLAEQKRAVAVATHDLALAWRYCHRFLVLGPGGVRLTATADHDALAADLSWAYEVDFTVTAAGPQLTTLPA